MTASRSVLAESVDLVSPEHGLVKLQFNSPEEANQAKAELLQSGRVVSVSSNFYYRPAMHYEARDVAPTKTAGEQGLFAPFLTLVEDLSAAAGIPAVGGPPTSVTPGVDPLAAKDWALKNINMLPISGLTAQSSMLTAVIDTGVDYNHEDLSGAMWRQSGNPQQVGFDFAHNDPRPWDNVHFDVEGCLRDSACRSGIDTSKFLVNPGHGTHCAGHVAAVYNNGIGLRGIGAGAKVMGLKFFYDYGEANAGQGDDAAAIKSIDFAIKNGVKVISASWGGRMRRQDAEGSELKAAIGRAQQAGVLFVVAAGNDAVDQDGVEDPSFPAAYDFDNMIVVAASDSKDNLANFSNFGGKSVHIAAPGVRILSTTVGSKYSDVVTRFKDPSGRERELAWDGTSMATPIVAGAVALVWSQHPTEDYRQIRDRILRTARKVPGLAGKVTTGGVLDVQAALK